METAAMRARTMFLVLAVGSIFGSSFVVVKVLVGEASPAQVTAWRLLFGGIAVLAVLRARGELRLPRRSLLAKAAVLALLDSVIPNTLLAWAQIRIDSATAALLISTMPMFTVLFAMALPGREQLSASKLYGIAAGLAGVALLVGADAQGAASGAPASHLAVLLAAMSNAAAVVYARALLAREDALELSGIKLASGALLAMPAAVVAGGGDVAPQLGLASWALLVALGVLSNGLGRTMYLSLIATAGSVRASLVAYVVPAVAVLLGWVVLGERIGARGFLGLVLIAFGLALVTHGAQLKRAFVIIANAPITAKLDRRSSAH